MTEEIATLPPPSLPPSVISSASNNTNQSKPQRSNPNDICNADLVNRFLAATPPYLYSPPVGPPNFFFSEMLRSLVQARNTEQNTRFLANQFRRPRKRLWPQNRMFDSNGNSITNSNSVEGSSIEKPLELTNKVITNKNQTSPKEFPMDERRKSSPEPPPKLSRSYTPPNIGNSTEPSTASFPPSVLPATPPLWYPHLYPPYGIDPLHFFIDLRVSSHIYDRKKENVSPTTNDNNNTNFTSNLETIQYAKHRIGSAFSVPPRREKSPLALNLTAAPIPKENTAFEFFNNNGDTNDDKSIKNTNYVLQNLPRIFAQGNDDKRSIASDEFDSKSDNEPFDFNVRDNEHSSEHSDDVVIVDQDSEQNERQQLKKIGKI